MQAARDGHRWLLKLDENSDLFETLTGFAEKEDLRAATVPFGIGMFYESSFGYWDGSRYQPHETSGRQEVVALHGTIARADGRPSIHLHGAVSGADHVLRGGHLLRAKVGVLLELAVDAFPNRTFGRPMVESVGLRVLDLEPGTDV